MPGEQALLPPRAWGMLRGLFPCDHCYRLIWILKVVWPLSRAAQTVTGHCLTEILAHGGHCCLAGDSSPSGCCLGLLLSVPELHFQHCLSLGVISWLETSLH